jgi:hypothetical protein
MRIVTSALVAVAALLPAAATAQTADYVEYGELTEQAARVATSIGSCHRLGFKITTDDSRMKAFTERTIRKGVMLGVDKTLAENMLLDALNREKEDLEYLSTVPEDIQTKEALFETFTEMMNFWHQRCHSIASSEVGSEFVQVTGNEDDVLRDTLNSMREELWKPAE